MLHQVEGKMEMKVGKRSVPNRPMKEITWPTADLARAPEQQRVQEAAAQAS
jgi:hypothetical protein